jgi:hypothetical protein
MSGKMFFIRQPAGINRCPFRSIDVRFKKYFFFFEIFMLFCVRIKITKNGGTV